MNKELELAYIQHHNHAKRDGFTPLNFLQFYLLARKRFPQVL